ncbi:phenylalanine aminomutase (D-beta-phenylalanine forming) [Rickettsiales bacterium LUAb2]
MLMSEEIFVIENKVFLEDFIKIVDNENITIRLAETIWSRVGQSRTLLEEFINEGRIIYGVNTGMGGFVNYLVPTEFAEQLQNNLISAVATNVGEFFTDKEVRAVMLARIVSLSKGNSAIKKSTLENYIKLFNSKIYPCIPKQGSLGASGDLGPLAYIALVLTGKWKARKNGKIWQSSELILQGNFSPSILSYKEGLALINGTSAMAGIGAISCSEADKLVDTYHYVSALSFEGLATKLKPFDPRVHSKKMHAGQLDSASLIFAILKDSDYITNEANVEQSLQNNNTNNHNVKAMDQQIEDAYSLRCTPQILGPIKDTLKFVKNIIENEINSSSDNPLVIPEEKEVFHNGHFHGQYISMAMDYLNISLTTLSNLSDRRIDRFMDKSNSNGLPPFLCANQAGLKFGLMGGQFMSTSLTAENRSLCTPISIQTLTSTGDFQDIVSMGLIAVRRSRDIFANTVKIICFELLCAAQAVDFRSKQNLATSSKILYDQVREVVPFIDEDVSITDYIENLYTLLTEKNLLSKLKISNI